MRPATYGSTSLSHNTLRAGRPPEAGTCSQTFETWERICALYGWPQTFVGMTGR